MTAAPHDHPATAEPLVSMKAAARARGVVYDTFRKHWRDWVRNEGFPPPTSTTRPYRWRPSALTAWQERAEAATRASLMRAGPGPGSPANQNEPGPQLIADTPKHRRDDRDRAAVMALMSTPYQRCR